MRITRAHEQPSRPARRRDRVCDRFGHGQAAHQIDERAPLQERLKPGNQADLPDRRRELLTGSGDPCVAKARPGALGCLDAISQLDEPST